MERDITTWRTSTLRWFLGREGVWCEITYDVPARQINETEQTHGSDRLIMIGERWEPPGSPDFADSCCGECPADTCYVDQVLEN